MRYLLLTLAWLASSYALPTFSQEKSTVAPKVRQQIDAMEMKYVEAYSQHDVATISALYTSDAGEVRRTGGSTRAGMFSGREAIEPMFAADFGSSGRLVSELVQVYNVDEHNMCALGNASVGT